MNVCKLPHPARAKTRYFPALLTAAALLLAPAAYAQTPVPALPVVGSSNPVSAEPLVPRPSTTPCIVTLFSGQQFIDYNDKDYTYTPPSNCKGPWSKVVLEADLNVSAGRQYDRTAKFFIGGANVYFGTTAEPRSNLSPSWHVERDITDLSALLATTQPVVASIGNYYGVSGGVDYNGIITGSAYLEFYPVGPNNPAPKEPDAVLPLSTAGATTALQTTADRLTGTFANLPKNIEGAYLELFSQSQADDEFWYTCSPNSVAQQLDDNCGNSAFRETEVYIDGKAAGIAPVFPWIYTGGIDPDLWEPITGVQTLNFKPYLVDLTPFAALLSNGQQHTVSMGVYNADAEFDVTGTLLLYLDHGSSQVTGALTEDTLGAAPDPHVQASSPSTGKDGNTYGETFVSSLRAFVLSGYVNTSHGMVKTTVAETVDFGNYQAITFNATNYIQNIAQLSGAYSITQTEGNGAVHQTQQTTVYPFTFNYSYIVNPDSTTNFVAHSYQEDYQYGKSLLNGSTTGTDGSEEFVESTDQYNLDANGNLITQKVGSDATYQSTDSSGHCYSRSLVSSGLALTSYTDGAACGGINHP